MVQHQPAPSAAAAGGGNASGTASGGGGGGGGAPTQAQPPSASTTPAPATAPAPTTPQPANNNGNGNGNTNNSIVSPSNNNNNNNVMTPVQAFAPAGQPIYNPQTLYMPSPHGHPHPSAHYQATMVPTPLPGNVYVNNVTANVNLHAGWSHTVPGYIPSGAAGGGHPQAHYISAHGEMSQVLQEQGNHLMHQLPQIPINPPQSHPSSRGRGQRRGRGGGGLRRQDYHNLRGHVLQPTVQQHPPTDSPSPVSNSLQLQSDQQPSSEAQMQAVSYYTPTHPYAYGTGIYFTHPQHQPNPAAAAAAAAAAQQATGPPLYMMYNAPLYNCGYIYQPLMQPHSEYQYMPPEDQVVDERGQTQHQQPDGGPQLWHTMAPIYNDDYQQQQQQQHQQQQMHPNGGQMVVNDELNHNSTSLPSSTDTSSTMLSPNYPAIYDPQIHEMQQQMGVMHICAEDFSQMSLIHQAASGQYDDELADVAQAPPPPHGTIPVAWTTVQAPGALSLAADGTALMQPPPQPQPSAAPLHIIQQQQQTTAIPVAGPVAIPVPVSAQVCIDPQPALAQLPVQQQQLPPPQPSSVHPPQAQTPTAQAQQQSHAEPLGES
ncbi:uncharacterized protein Dwil_GK27498 [Drosophila willistoni]|uniref:Uncharacterized protein n=1 Tax=Drosophila willistoni TaxID=7260 RepID=A0A0Q9WP25_DROWI|nr:uncharacterized protein Dwil_GK27498 [Drosophila willistoni]